MQANLPSCLPRLLGIILLLYVLCRAFSWFHGTLYLAVVERAVLAFVARVTQLSPPRPPQPHNCEHPPQELKCIVSAVSPPRSVVPTHTLLQVRQQQHYGSFLHSKVPRPSKHYAPRTCGRRHGGYFCAGSPQTSLIFHTPSVPAVCCRVALHPSWLSQLLHGPRDLHFITRATQDTAHPSEYMTTR